MMCLNKLVDKLKKKNNNPIQLFLFMSVLVMVKCVRMFTQKDEKNTPSPTHSSGNKSVLPHRLFISTLYVY